MKKQKRSPQERSRTAKKKAAPQPTAAAAPKSRPRSRREALLTLRNWGIGALVAGGAGTYFYTDVQARIQEADLTRIGNGAATVVQIHDPDCPICRRLQSEARCAVSEFHDDQLQFLVANIRNDAGRRFANAHGVGHATLILFDGEGRAVDVLVGERPRDMLAASFRTTFDLPGL